MSNVKTFLQKWITNNLGFKILALVFAFVLWLVITNITDPVMTRTIAGIPVQIENEERVLDGSRVYTVVSGNTATIVVSGNRSVIGNLTASDFVATADFSELSITNAVPIHVELTGEKARHASAVTIALQTHSMVISLEKMDEVTINVEVEFTGTKAENMLIEDAASSPAKVTLHAPESIVKQADRAVVLINYWEVTGDMMIQKAPVIYDLNGDPIELTENIYLDAETVNITITTSKIKSVPIHIEASGSPAEGYELTDIIYSKNRVSIRGDENRLAEIDAIVLPDTLLTVQGAKEDVKLIVNMEDFLPYGVTFYGDTGTVTITATIAKIEEPATENVPEEETTNGG